MLAGPKKWIRIIFWTVVVLILISPIIAGHLVTDVISSFQTFFHTAHLHAPHVTPPKVGGLGRFHNWIS